MRNIKGAQNKSPLLILKKLQDCHYDNMDKNIPMVCCGALAVYGSSFSVLSQHPSALLHFCIILLYLKTFQQPFKIIIRF